MSLPVVYADLQNADIQGRLRLNCIGTIRDLDQHQIALHEGLELTLYDEDLQVDGKVLFSQEEHVWVAVIEWERIRPKRDAHVGDAPQPSSMT